MREINEIKYREKLFKLLVENTEDVFIVFSPEGYQVEYVSPNAASRLGIEADVIKKDIRNIFKWEGVHIYKITEAELRALQDGDCWTGDSQYIHRTTGEMLWFHQNLYKVSIEGSSKYILVLSDRTKEVNDSERLEEALNLANNANDSKSNFLANMSHDIRTPINAIEGMIKIAQENLYDEEKLRKCLDNIVTSSDHLKGLINDVLDMSKIETGNMFLRETACNLRELSDRVVKIIRPQTNVKLQSLEVNIEVIEHENVLVDEVKINKILLNLLSNAVKYTGEEGNIKFSLEELGKTSEHHARYKFVIEDNGMGMSDEFMKNIFNPFARSEVAVKARFQGTGLGMAITKTLIDAMGGSIDLESEEGKGSKFTVLLDFQLAEASEEGEEGYNIQEKEVETMTYDYTNKRFLLAEDYDMNAEIIIELLNIKGAEIDWAEDGGQAVEMFKAKPAGYYDGIFMDILMPVMNGYETTKEIRKLTENGGDRIKIIAMTANAFSEDIKKAMDAGMDGHIAKPIDFDQLAEMLAK